MILKDFRDPVAFAVGQIHIEKGEVEMRLQKRMFSRSDRGRNHHIGLPHVFKDLDSKTMAISVSSSTTKMRGLVIAL